MAAAAWTPDELDRIGRAGELRVAGVRSDGTPRRLVIIWQVRVGDDIYIRSVNGPSASWFRGTQVSGVGRIEAGGVAREVAFTPVAAPAAGATAPAADAAAAGIEAAVDAAYRAKYGSGSAVAAVTAPLASSSTLRVIPR